MKQRDIAILLIPVFILVVLWVIFNVYHNYVNSTITDPLTYQLVPIEGKFDENTINDIKARKRVDSVVIITSPEAISPSPETSEIEEQTSSPSGNINTN